MVAYARFITPTDVAFSLLEAFRRFDEGLGETMGRIVQSAQLRLSEVRQSLVHTQTVLQYQLPKVLDSHRNRLGEVAKNLVFKSKEMTMNQLFRLRSLAQDMSRGVELRMDRERQQIARLGEALPKGCRGTLQRRQRECDAVDGKLKLLSPDNVLKRGYSITLKDGKAVTAAADLRPGDRIVTRFHEGEVTSTVDVGAR